MRPEDVYKVPLALSSDEDALRERHLDLVNLSDNELLAEHLKVGVAVALSDRGSRDLAWLLDRYRRVTSERQGRARAPVVSRSMRRAVVARDAGRSRG